MRVSHGHEAKALFGCRAGATSGKVNLPFLCALLDGIKRNFGLLNDCRIMAAGALAEVPNPHTQRHCCKAVEITAMRNCEL